LQLNQQALALMPDDATLHEFLALVLFAQEKYDQAAAPLYAVLSVGPGWHWTTLSGMYDEVATYTAQLRALEAYIKAHPDAAGARFVLAYYLCQGHDEAAVAELKDVLKLKPDDTLSRQLVARYQPDRKPDAEAPDAETTPAKAGKLAGDWTASPAKGTTIALKIKDDGAFGWTVTAASEPAKTIDGTSRLADGVLTLAAEDGP
jgi:tetratricopeptide (TPR) repeat protein